jgi:hypothetical protein
MGNPNMEDIEETHALPVEGSNRTAASGFRGKIRFVSEEISALPPAAQSNKPLAVAPEKSAKDVPAEGAKHENPNAGAPIIISIGPSGVMIASEDTKALDEFEKLFTSLAGANVNNNAYPTIFYLKHAKADVVKELLESFFSGGSVSGDGGGNLLGDLAGAAMGESGGGLVGSLLGGMGGGSIKPSGSVKITSDPRLNALVVQASPADLDLLEELLKIIDQKGSPEEVLIAPKPRMIPLMNTDAEKMAEIVKSTFQNRLEASAGQGGGNQPNPMQLLQMLRGGGGRRGGGGGGNQAQEIEKMTVTADTRTNSLIVAASDALFQDVKELVEKLDVISSESSESVITIPTHHASTEAIQAGLQSILGDNVQFSRSSAGSSGSRPGGSPQGMPMFGQGGGGRRGQFGGGQFGGGYFGGGGQPNFGGGGQNYGGGGNRGGTTGGGNRSGGNRGGSSGNRGGGNRGG